ncbi:MAG: alanine racemase, partial [Bacteroidales bacterium]|nr:alanine racemase [Bacteroidales bacterium]
QTNKVKYIASFVSMIHSIDSLRLLETVDKEAAKHDRVIDCLLQFHIATEETKFGLSMDEARQLLESPEYKAMKNVRICGVMGMATNTDDTALVRSEFANLRSIFNTLKQSYFLNGTQASSPATELMTPANSQDCDSFREISMGMSHDYPIALEEGATLVRVGSAIFGARNYTSM